MVEGWVSKVGNSVGLMSPSLSLNVELKSHNSSNKALLICKKWINVRWEDPGWSFDKWNFSTEMRTFLLQKCKCGTQEKTVIKWLCGKWNNLIGNWDIISCRTLLMISIVTKHRYCQLSTKTKVWFRWKYPSWSNGIMVICQFWLTVVSAVCNALTTPCYISQS